MVFKPLFTKTLIVFDARGSFVMVFVNYQSAFKTRRFILLQRSLETERSCDFDMTVAIQADCNFIVTVVITLYPFN